MGDNNDIMRQTGAIYACGLAHKDMLKRSLVCASPAKGQNYGFQILC